MNSENKTTSPNKPNWTSNIGVVIFAIAWFAFGYYFVLTQPKQTVKVIDCSLVEISPDFTPEVREACRKARSGRI
jgi:hypothetical protein